MTASTASFLLLVPLSLTAVFVLEVVVSAFSLPPSSFTPPTLPPVPLSGLGNVPTPPLVSTSSAFRFDDGDFMTSSAVGEESPRASLRFPDEGSGFEEGWDEMDLVREPLGLLVVVALVVVVLQVEVDGRGDPPGMDEGEAVREESRAEGERTLLEEDEEVSERRARAVEWRPDLKRLPK